MSDTQELQELLEKGAQTRKADPRRTPPSQAEQPASLVEKRDILEHIQWEVLPNGTFAAAGSTQSHLTPGAYLIDITDRGPIFVSKSILTDDLIDLGDSNSERVVQGIRLFWSKKEQYKRRGMLFKRGILMWGPAGSGKTATLSLLVRDLIAQGGIVLLVQNPKIATMALPILRKIEPERPLIVVLEDVEEIISSHGEHDLLALLDGEHQTNNVCNIATTNYPENLGPRIVNRPSRFDEVVKIGFPTPSMREQYLWHALRHEKEGKYPVAQWVRQTEGMSVAHLKELVVAVTCLDQPFENVIERLKGMRVSPKSKMYEGEVGFGARLDELAKEARAASMAGGNPSR